MADDKSGREKKADDAERRQRERELEEARERADEPEPPRAEEDADAFRTCHRRGCNALATFVVLERYQEETGHGAVEAEAFLCREHTAEESPTNLDGAYADYVFRVEPIAAAENPTE